MRIAFMGTPDFAVRSLEALVDNGHDVVAVITQPDRPKGRGNKLAFPPVKEKAIALGIPVLQPSSVKDDLFQHQMVALQVDVFVVVAFGRILPEAILQIPKFGAINVHGSILPAYRGAAPIQRAIINGERSTGVTIMQMDVGMDTGDILLQQQLTIEQEDTTGSLFIKLAELGSQLLIEALAQLEAGTLQAIAQDEALATHAAMIEKSDEKVQWTSSASQLFYLIKGLNPSPGAYTYLEGERLKIWESRVIEMDTTQLPGMIVELTQDGFVVQTGGGCLEILQIQLAGKKMTSAKELSRRGLVQIGMQLGVANE